MLNESCGMVLLKYSTVAVSTAFGMRLPIDISRVWVRNPDVVVFSNRK
jgi:hypothetical protein